MFDRLVPVKQLMTDKVVMVEPETVMTEVADLFRTHAVHHIPVVDQGKVLGMISTADINRLEHHFTLFKSSQAEKVNSAIFASMLAREVMSPNVVAVKETDSAQFAVDIFRENLFRALPVVDEDRNIVGILTPYDLMIYAYTPEHSRLT